MLDEKKLVYVAGHNIIMYNLEDFSQTFIPGSENASEINFITLSPSGRYLAYCEKAEPRAQVIVYELTPVRRKRKAIPDPEMDNLPI